MKRFGKYRIEERIAVGGTAEVFRAVALGRGSGEEQVVLKRILPQHAKDATFRQLFREEALLLASLDHPNIIRLRDFGERRGELFLALEYVEGADLDVLLARAARCGAVIPPPLAAFVTLQLCNGLACMHTATSADGTPLRIVHRDVSPHNVLISTAGEVKLADLGIAKSVIRSGRTTEGTIKGKFDYLSPEQATPGAEVDARSDLFSVGTVLCEMLLGQPPFRGASEIETLERVRSARYQLDPVRLASQHRPLLELVQGCLQLDPAQRISPAEAIAARLEAFLVPSETPVDAEALGRWVQLVLGQEDVAGSEIDGLVQDLFRPEQRGNTAVLVEGGQRSTPPQFDESTQLPFDESTPSPRLAGRRWLPTALLVLVAMTLTAVATLVLSGRLGSPRQAPRRPAVAPAPDGAATPAGKAAAGGARGAAADGPKEVDALDAAPPTVRPDAGRAADRGAAIHWITIRSLPAGATVWLDGARVGQTPLRVERPQRAARLRLTRAGYLSWRRRLSPRARDTVLRARLRRKRRTGRLSINCFPWAHVYVDGRRIGTTPLRRATLPVGKHRVVLRDRQGRLLRSFVTRVRSGHTAVHSFNLGN